MAKPLLKNFDTCPMLSRSDWGVGQIQSRGLTHALSVGQSSVGFHGPRVAGWLLFMNGCHRGEDMRLPVGETKIGSSWMNDAVLTGVGIGSQHAVIRMGVGEGSIASVSAERVVKINNVPINGRHSLEDGALLTIGDVHCIVRFAEQMNRGYQPPEAPKPMNMPTQAVLKEAVCGWFVMTRGALLGQDFRIVNGKCRIGSSPGLEISIPDAHLAKHALTLHVTMKGCKVDWVCDGHKLLVNGNECGVDTALRESDVISIDHVEGYIKWARS